MELSELEKKLRVRDETLGCVDVFDRTMSYLEKPPGAIEIPGWKQFNEITGGLRLHEMTLVCAPTGVGKTQINANISARLLLAGVPHFVASVETGMEDFMLRILSCLEGRDLNSGEIFDFTYIEALKKKYRHKFEDNLIMMSKYDTRVDPTDMLLQLQDAHETFGCKVLIADNLNFFLRITSSQMEKAEMDESIHRFVMLAKKIPVHIWLITHPRKTEHGRVVSEFDIKGSSTAVQEASNVLLINRPSPEDIQKNGYSSTDREFRFAKLRKRGQSVGRKIFYQYINGGYEELISNDPQYS